MLSFIRYTYFRISSCYCNFATFLPFCQVFYCFTLCERVNFLQYLQIFWVMFVQTALKIQFFKKSVEKITVCRMGKNGYSHMAWGRAKPHIMWADADFVFFKTVYETGKRRLLLQSPYNPKNLNCQVDKFCLTIYNKGKQKHIRK